MLISPPQQVQVERLNERCDARWNGSRQHLFAFYKSEKRQAYLEHDDCRIAVIKRKHTDMTRHRVSQYLTLSADNLQDRLLRRRHLDTRASALTSNGSTASSITESVLQKTRCKKLLTVFRKWHFSQGDFGPHFLHRWTGL